MSYSVPSRIWDPQTALQVVNPARGHITCVGDAPSKRRRCENIIASVNESYANDILNKISRKMPIECRDDELAIVAKYLLCRRNHQGQNSEMVWKWKEVIRNEQRRIEEQRSPWTLPETSSLQPVSRVSSTRPRADSFISSSPSPSALRQAPLRTNPAQSLPPRTTFGQPLPRSSSAAFSALEPSNQIGNGLSQSASAIPRSSFGNPSVTPTSSNRQTTTNSANLRFRAPSPRPTASIPTVPSVVANTRQPSPPPAVATNPPAPVVQAVQAQPTPLPQPAQPAVPAVPAPPAPCTAQHAQRRPLEDEKCPICTTLLINVPLSELVWCKAGVCGKSLCRDCFEPWRRQCAESRVPVTCVFCRARWTSCRHDTETRPPYEMWGCEPLWAPDFFESKRHRFDLWNAAFEVDLPKLFNPRTYRETFDVWNDDGYNGVSKLFHMKVVESGPQVLDLQTTGIRDLFKEGKSASPSLLEGDADAGITWLFSSDNNPPRVRTMFYRLDIPASETFGPSRPSSRRLRGCQWLSSCLACGNADEE